MHISPVTHSSIQTVITEHLALPVIFPKFARNRIEINRHTLSIQASENHYCIPQVDNAESYEAVEVGFPDFDFPQWFIDEYAENVSEPQETVYAYVPIDVLVQAIYEVLNKETNYVSNSSLCKW